MNEFGMLTRFSVITSVSGGSILNGVLASRWSRLHIDPSGIVTDFENEVALPVREFCGNDIRTSLLILTRLNPVNWPALLRDYFSVSGNYLAKSYEALYRRSLLSDVPQPREQTPRFVFCSTNVRTGACWHFHGGPNGKMGDFYTGYCEAGHVHVSEAVAASSAFTPGFSAMRVRLDNRCRFTRIDPWGKERPVSAKRGSSDHDAGTARPILTDGGVYDNLGVEPVWGRYSLFVSDAGAPFSSVRSNSQLIITRLKRAIDISLEQVGAVRRRWLVDELSNGRQQGALWTIHTLPDDFDLPDANGYSPAVRRLLQRIRTDLNRFTEGEIACLENHGYSLADAAIRSRAIGLCPNPAAAFHWPHPDWLEDSKSTKALAMSHRRNVFRDIGKLFTRLQPQ
jgi:NTE family protein